MTLGNDNAASHAENDAVKQIIKAMLKENCRKNSVVRGAAPIEDIKLTVIELSMTSAINGDALKKLVSGTQNLIEKIRPTLRQRVEMISLVAPRVIPRMVFIANIRKIKKSSPFQSFIASIP
jgi:hypothetical protein